MLAVARALGASAWHSPVFTTWGSLGARMLGFAAVLSLMLALLPEAEVAAWFLFFGLNALIALIADFGFTVTFIRAVAYANAKREGGGAMEPVIRTMRALYSRIALAAVLLAALPGTAALWGPLAQVRVPAQAWWAWALMALSGVVVLHGAMYAAFLQGSERIAIFRRSEMVVVLAALGASCAVLLLGGGLAGLACVHLAAAVAGYVRNRSLAVRAAPAGAWGGTAGVDPDVMRTVVPAAWRSGLGVVATYGAIQGSGVAYAQLAAPAEVASYLLALRLMQALGDTASVPFNAKLPALARMYADGRSAELIATAARGMLWVNWLFVCGIAAIGLTGASLLAFIGSRTPFVASEVWWLLGTALLVERIGAMHLQLSSTTNRIVWHIANGISGLLMIGAMALGYAWLGVAGLPLGMLAAYAAFYAPFSMRHSYRAFGLTPAFDFAASAAPLALCAGGLLVVLAR
jgi:O-antigen/teichoic acid export membrane protein